MQDEDKPEINEGEPEGELGGEADADMIVDVEEVDVEEVDEADMIVEVDEPSNDYEEPSETFVIVDESPSRLNDDDKTSEAPLLRKNSIDESNVRTLAEETQNGTPDKDEVLSIAHRNLSNEQYPADGLPLEPKPTELFDPEQDGRKPSKGEQELTLSIDAEDDGCGVIDSADAASEIPLVQMKSAESTPVTVVGVEASSSSRISSKNGLHQYEGLTALTVAIDSVVKAQDEHAQLQQSKLDNGIEVAATTSDSKAGQEKTELQREMELFEAAERELGSQLIFSMRSDQSSTQVDSSVEGTGLIDNLNDKKRASESIPNEARKKRGKRLLLTDDSKEEEDVCFICFDGGDLVLCDRRTCPKAYHLNCIGRDAAFFQKKGAWICGWHFCSICTKPANFQCYTCPTAYCNGCLNKADFLCVRQRKGLCEECWPIVKMIENNETVNGEGVLVDFTDQETYECLFKEYWEDLKLRLSLTPTELDKDAKAAGGSEAFLSTIGSDDDNEEDYSTGSDEIAGVEDDADVFDGSKKSERKKKKRGKAKAQLAEGEDADVEIDDEAEPTERSDSENEEDDGLEDADEELGEDNDDEEGNGQKPDLQPLEFDGWASKELIEFVKFMDEDPKKPLSRSQVTKLLFSYIKSQKLQDPRKKTQIVCDDRLQTIFGKKIVGQSEMFKHLQAHFAPKGAKRSIRQARDDQTNFEPEGIDEDALEEKFTKKDVRDRRRKRKSDEDKFERPNLDEFAAVTPKNIGLIYLRRQLLEELLDDTEFESKVCNTFVRIRVPGMSSKSEMCYRLVQVVGTRLQAEHYKAGRKLTNIVLEILNLQKREDVTVDLVSNHDFNEEECQRLRQSIKCGFIKTLTVGDVEDKARSLQEAKVNDWFETERQRLVNLRDRASEKGRKKELRECVEKLQELNSPAFRAAKLQARPEVTADPRMDPNYESDGNDDKSGTASKDGMPSSFEKTSFSAGIEDKSFGLGRSSNNESSRMDWDSQRNRHPTWAGTHRSRDGERGYQSIRSSEKPSSYGRAHQYGVESAGARGGYDERDRGWDKEWTMERDGIGEAGWTGNGKNRAAPAEKWVDLSVNVDSRSGRNDYRGMTGMTTPVFDAKPDWRKEQALPAAPSVQQGFGVSPQNVLSPAAMEAAEKEKIWHYMDPTGTVQGPFSMEQLRKWNQTGYFPTDLRIWKASQAREESILLTDGLAGRLHQQRETWGSAARLPNPIVASIQLDDIAQVLGTNSTAGYNSNQSAIKSGDGWRENGGASSWAERTGSGDAGRSTSWSGGDASQSNRSFTRDVATGPSAPVKETSSDMKWKPGPAASSWDPYVRNSYNNSPTRSGRADAAARFDPANWGSRSASVRLERDNWGSSQSPGNEGGGYSKSAGRSSWGRGSHFRDSGSWNPDDSGHDSGSRSRATRASRKDIPCRFHQKGYCKRGDSCDFWHG